MKVVTALLAILTSCLVMATSAQALEIEEIMGIVKGKPYKEVVKIEAKLIGTKVSWKGELFETRARSSSPDKAVVRFYAGGDNYIVIFVPRADSCEMPFHVNYLIDGTIKRIGYNPEAGLGVELGNAWIRITDK